METVDMLSNRNSLPLSLVDNNNNNTLLKTTVLVHLPIPFCQETMVSGRSTETVNLIKCSRMTMGKWVESRLLLLFAFTFYVALCCELNIYEIMTSLNHRCPPQGPAQILVLL